MIHATIKPVRTTLLAVIAMTGLGPVAASAQDWDVVRGMLALLASEDDYNAQKGAFAACLLGDGDPEATVKLFTKAGWEAEDAGGGAIDILPPRGNLIAGIYLDGDICSVSNYAQATEEVPHEMEIFLTATGFSWGGNLMVDGCPQGWRIGNEVIASLTSGGQDPECTSPQSNEVRFYYGAVP